MTLQYFKLNLFQSLIFHLKRRGILQVRAGQGGPPYLNTFKRARSLSSLQEHSPKQTWPCISFCMRSSQGLARLVVCCHYLEDEKLLLHSTCKLCSKLLLPASLALHFWFPPLCFFQSLFCRSGWNTRSPKPGPAYLAGEWYDHPPLWCLYVSLYIQCWCTDRKLCSSWLLNASRKQEYFAKLNIPPLPLPSS